MNNELEQQSVPQNKEVAGGFLFDALEMFAWSLAILLQQLIMNVLKR